MKKNINFYFITIFILIINSFILMADTPKEFCIDLGERITMEFVLIKSGSFMMGSFDEEGDEDETIRHKVNISKPFYIGKYEVTQEQWKQLMKENPSHFIGNKNPVDTISWNDCISFTKKISILSNNKLTLPTEAQWEYACRADTDTKWFFGSKENDADQYGWIDSNSDKTTHPVGMKKSNKWGIYDLYGNIQEWCLDWYQSSYSKIDIVDPTGPKEGASRVIRGGGWGEFPNNARSSYRNATGENEKNDGTGFRCVIILD